MASRSLEETLIADETVAGGGSGQLSVGHCEKIVGEKIGGEAVRDDGASSKGANAGQTTNDYQGLRRELCQLDERLEGEDSWRALAQLDEREARGQPLTGELGAQLRTSLTASLASNRIFRARTKVSEALAILDEKPAILNDKNRPGAKLPQVEKLKLGVNAEGQGDDQQPAKNNRSAFRTQVNVKQKPDGFDRVAVMPAPTPAPTPAKQITPDKLQLIKGIDSSLAAQLNDQGVSRYEQIAQWSAADVTSHSSQLGLRGQIERGNWIEQAAVLFAGKTTHFTRLSAAGVCPIVVPAPKPPSDAVGRLLFPRLAPIVIAKPRPLNTEQLATKAKTLDRPSVALPAKKASADTVEVLSPVPVVSLLASLKSIAADEPESKTAEQQKPTEKPSNEPAEPEGFATATAFPKSDYTGDFLSRPFLTDPTTPSELRFDAPLEQKSKQPQPLITQSAPETPAPVTPAPLTPQPVVLEPVIDKPQPEAGADELVENEHATAYGEDSLATGGTRVTVPLFEDLSARSSAFDAPRRRISQAVLDTSTVEPQTMDDDVDFRGLDATPEVKSRRSTGGRIEEPKRAAERAQIAVGLHDLDDEAEVKIVPRNAPDASQDIVEDAGGENGFGEDDGVRQRPALGRVTRDNDHRENPIESHAAYRMETDEASVTIVHHDGRENAPDLPFYKQNEHWEREGTIRKFMKALTGD